MWSDCDKRMDDSVDILPCLPAPGPAAKTSACTLCRLTINQRAVRFKEGKVQPVVRGVVNEKNCRTVVFNKFFGSIRQVFVDNVHSDGTGVSTSYVSKVL